MPELPTLHFDMEHSKILENLPIFFIFGIIILTFLPQIPPSFKGPLMIFGIPLTIVVMFAVDKVALVQAAENMVLKARIYGWDLEREFHCKNPIGPIQSTYNPATDKYVTPFELKIPVSLPVFGDIDAIEIEHKLPWATRCKPSHGWVHYKGIEVKHTNTYLISLYPPNRSPNIDHLQVIPRFRLQEGNQDVYLRKNRPRIDVMLEAIPQ